MRVPFDARRNIFIHDLDGVHYRYKDNPQYVDFLVYCGALAAQKILGEDNITVKEFSKALDIRQYRQASYSPTILEVILRLVLCCETFYI